MLKQIFGSRPTTKFDVYLTAGAAVMAVLKAFDVHRQYKSEQDNKTEENQK